jgi:ectoine hydroxylase-related dioxygenase (phytanoyl-CoA dioxygenase family)
MDAPPEAAEVLSPEDRDKFERDGYLVIDSVGSPESVLDGAVSDLEDLYTSKEGEEKGVGYFRHRIRNGWKISSNVRALSLDSKVLSVLQALYGRTPMPFQTLNFRKPSRQAAHSDGIHFNSVPQDNMCGVWIALEDMDMDNGPLIYYPGSHKLPLVTMQDVGVEAGRDHYSEYTRHIANLIDEQGLQPAYATISKGQALFWATNLLHGGAPVNDKDRTRLSQVTHYYFEGCKYYNPMESEPDNLHWTTPAWVT